MNAALLWFFHRRFWYAPDEGNYAHVAERLLAGEVLHLQVQDVHPGPINFLNAAAFGLFGLDLVSLRYPLVLASLLGALGVFWLFPRKEAGTALVASVAVTALGVLQFLNPSANWYCLALVIAITGCLTWWQQPGKGRLVLLGFLLGTLALFRHLTGAFIGLGVLCCLLLEAPGSARGKEVLLQRLLLALGALGLVVHLASASDPTGWVLFGIWPVLLLLWLCKHARTPNREVLRMVGWLAAGALTAVLPLLVYHLVNGSFGAWLEDVTAGALAITRLGIFRRSLLGPLAMAGLQQIFSGRLDHAVNGIHWLVLPLLAAINGILVLRALSRQEPAGSKPLHLVAVFNGLVTHYQIPIYLSYTVGLSLVSLLALSRPDGGARKILIGCTGLLAFVAVHYHAGQSLSRGLYGMLTGQRLPVADARPMPRNSLLIEPGERARYLETVALIRRETRPDETIFALPSNAELYFLAGRRNPFRFFSTALGVRDDGALQEARRVLSERPPRLVIYNPHDKYGTPQSAQLMQTVRSRYALLRTIGELEIYRLP